MFAEIKRLARVSAARQEDFYLCLLRGCIAYLNHEATKNDFDWFFTLQVMLTIEEFTKVEEEINAVVVDLMIWAAHCFALQFHAAMGEKELATA